MSNDFETSCLPKVTQTQPVFKDDSKPSKHLTKPQDIVSIWKFSSFLVILSSCWLICHATPWDLTSSMPIFILSISGSFTASGIWPKNCFMASCFRWIHRPWRPTKWNFRTKRDVYAYRYICTKNFQKDVRTRGCQWHSPWSKHSLPVHLAPSWCTAPVLRTCGNYPMGRNDASRFWLFPNNAHTR